MFLYSFSLPGSAAHLKLQPLSPLTGSGLLSRLWGFLVSYPSIAEPEEEMFTLGGGADLRYCAISEF